MYYDLVQKPTWEEIQDFPHQRLTRWLRFREELNKRAEHESERAQQSQRDFY